MDMAALNEWRETINEWRETIERLGIGALIVICLTALLWKSGRFTGPLLKSFFDEFLLLMRAAQEANKSFPVAIQQNADNTAKLIELTESSTMPRDLAKPGVELMGHIAQRVGVSPDDAHPLLEEMRGAVRR